MKRSIPILAAALAGMTTVQAGVTMASAAPTGPPMPSPNKQPMIAFVSRSCPTSTTSCTDSVDLVNEDGTGLKTLATYPTGVTVTTVPKWSPDGKNIAYGVTYGRNSGYPSTAPFVAAVDGSNAFQVAAAEPGYTSLAWSGNDRRLAFVQDGNVEVVTVGSGAASPPTTILSNTSYQTLDWSPTADAIALSDTNSIAVVAADGTGLRTVVTRAQADQATNSCGGYGQLGAPAWSPDGQWIAFTGPQCSHDESGYASGVPGIINPTTDQLIMATGLPHSHGGNYSDPFWDPTGTSYAVAIGTQIYVASLDGSLKQTDSAQSVLGAVTPPQVFAPDAQAIAMLETVTPTTEEIHLLTTDGSGGDLPLATTVGAVSAAFSPTPLATRYAGISRVDTANAIAEAVPSGASTVVLARDDLYPDGLSGGPLAADKGGPLLLTDPNTLPPSVCFELSGRLGPSTIYVMGDSTAISDTVINQVQGCDGHANIERVAGPTRFDTAAAAAELIGGTSVYITEGIDSNPARGWPDAVAVSDLAAYQHRPILLTQTDSLPQGTITALENLHVTTATIIGGSDVVSDTVAQELTDMGIAVNRVAGTDRYATSADIATLAAQSGLSSNKPWLVIGNNWPDALAAGPAAAKDGGDLLLVDGTTLDNSPASESWLTNQGTNITNIRLAGGADVLSPADEVKAIQIAGG